MSRDLVTGAFSYSGARITELLLSSGRSVRTLTFHPGRDHPLRDRIEVLPYRFDDPTALAESLTGISTLYNTYWVRFDHGPTTFDGAVANSRALFEAAKLAGVERVVHISIANPSLQSRLPYYRGKALVEQALRNVHIPYSIVRPTWIFGGKRDVLTNNIAWILRHLPVFALPGDGRYPVQPVHVDDLAAICLEAARATTDVVVDAAGPERMSFAAFVHAVRGAVGARAPIVRVPSPVMGLAARALGLVLRDVVLTADEIRGLTAGLLVSHERPRGRIPFTHWLRDQRHALGRSYANELRRHFAPVPA